MPPPIECVPLADDRFSGWGLWFATSVSDGYHKGSLASGNPLWITCGRNRIRRDGVALVA